ncbi:NUDIX hydrolase [Gordonia sp. ABSL1-1]|uniref:NUDIX hydrolase n=1 Tax=Gordonia sp. ABSL1-1 TaxID=3053923 RepID=UPI0025741715|nr:NUDIX hydrolase [Gordonia sp. ABSL1-1]MDL9936425.1 NUDIX hydrolase [Gordonia sp. ABSL1-1]
MTTLVIVGVAIMLLGIGWAYQTANRLDRLNVRVDLARQSLHAALDRRSVVARAIASDMAAGSDPVATSLARELATVADRAERVDPPDREAAENALSGILARTDSRARPPALIAELADAETRVMIARRFYNDAVRDTRNLAERRLVRWLRLGGHAQLPVYFEIIERAGPGNP